MERPMKKSKLPKTDSIQESAEFWDTHDLSDFEEELKEVAEPVFVRDTSLRDRLDELIPGHLFSPARLDRDLVADFFMLFARAEFALKRAGFASPGRGDKINVDWDGFARSLGRPVTKPADPQVADAVRYLQARPPRKQVLKDGRL